MSLLNGKGLASGMMKDGKGVDKNAPKKKGFFLFWDIVWHKLGKFIQANVLYSLLSLLWIAFLYVIAPVRLEWVQSIVGNGEGAEYQVQAMVFGLREMFTLIMFNLWGNPLLATSYAYITRCFTRGEPVWIWSDGWDVFKDNFKKSIALFFIDAAVIIMGINAIYFYYVQYISTGGYMWLFVCGLFCALMFIYTIMHYYIYQIMITFECTLGQLFKNSILCSIAHLPVAVLHTVISAGLIILLSFAVYPGIVIVFNILVGLCVTRYPMEFYAARVIKKMINQQEKNESKNKAKITYLKNGEDK
ncbi:MAG: hypothetical protein Q4G33_05485 [bacterium]|nr:hypothetical protein [bacterium]